ncbi:MAG: DinB family protein [Gemmatimonadetes bacterium]|nr:DinB family protein [Gemmatimonadota bacterium]MDA1104497.1 DinB family protein [Gemmatimonadota bacterium]
MRIDRIEDFLSYFEGVHQRTRGVALCIPEESLEWSPGEGRFTPGDLVRHIASTERWMWAENVQQLPSRYPGHGPELARGKDAVLAHFEAMHQEAVEIFRALTPDRLQLRCATVGGIDMSVWKWLRLMAEHEIHHRGQLYELMARLGVSTPSLYGLTEAEVRERSI